MGVRIVKEVVLLKDIKEVELVGDFGFWDDPNDDDIDGWGFKDYNGKVTFLEPWFEKFSKEKFVTITISKYTNREEQELAEQVRDKIK